MSSVTEGLRPAKFYEKPMPKVGHASACQPAGRPGFFDPVNPGVISGTDAFVCQPGVPYEEFEVMLNWQGALKNRCRVLGASASGILARRSWSVTPGQVIYFQ